MTFYTLNIFIENDELRNKYISSIQNRNKQDAGFDLFCPDNYQLSTVDKQFKCNTEIVCSMVDPNGNNCSYYLYPRSSISKTNLRLANSVGIIDAGYRGPIIGIFDILDDFYVEKHSRLLQICSPNLSPIEVNIVLSLEELGLTDRGSGGFGSTGK
jgi:dUTP pyrophosphatase